MDQTIVAQYSLIAAAIIAACAALAAAFSGETGRSKGYGFVEMADDEAGDKAIAALNEVDMDGKTLSVSVARPREERPRRSYGNNGGGGYRGGNNSRGGGYGGSRGDNGYGGGRNRY